MCLTGTFALWLVLPEFELHKGETYPALALVIIVGLRALLPMIGPKWKKILDLGQFYFPLLCCKINDFFFNLKKTN